MKKMLLLLALICGTGAMVHAQTAWELKKDEDGIKVYTGTAPGTHIRAVKVTCVVNTSMSALTALLMDAGAHEQWVYSTKKSYLVKQLTPASLVYYSEIAMPWPLSNRDVVVEMNISQQPATNVLVVKANAVAQYVPLNKSKVRITRSEVTWTVTPVGNNQLSVEYTGLGDPGGEVPAWLANSFSIKGPFETFKSLKKLVVSPGYARAQYAFIKE